MSHRKTRDALVAISPTLRRPAIQHHPCLVALLSVLGAALVGGCTSPQPIYPSTKNTFAPHYATPSELPAGDAKSEGSERQ